MRARRNDSPWNDGAVRELERLLPTGLSATVIADHLSTEGLTDWPVSKSAVLGKALRMRAVAAVSQPIWSTNMAICKNCEEPFKPVRKGRQFCSRECAAHFRIRNVTPKAEAFKASYTDDPGEAARPFRPVRLPRPGEVVIRSSAWWV